MLDRRAKILSGLDLPQLMGIEIGPLDRPLVRRSDGHVIYVDHVCTEDLRKKYEKDANVDNAKIVGIDAVWGGATLSEAVGDRGPVDYVVASHVIEHVPDMLAWLEEIRQVLKPGGELRLAIPDRRFSFDFLRRESSLADLLNAYAHHARKPRPISILDFMLNAAPVDCAKVWDGQFDSRSLVPWASPESALLTARAAIDNDTYHDVHCWVFTPESFIDVCRSASSMGLLKFCCSKIYNTQYYNLEFFVHLIPCEDLRAIEESWEAASIAVKADALSQAKHPGSTSQMEKLETRYSDAEKKASDAEALLASSEARIATAEANLAAAHARINDLKSTLKSQADAFAARENELKTRLLSFQTSTSWRITAPLRAIVTGVRGH